MSVINLNTTPTSNEVVTWEWKQPPTGQDAQLAPDWLKETWELRGRVLSDGGREGFLQPDGSFSDQDYADFYCYHLLVRLEGKLIGCLRSLPLLAPVPGLVETLIGAARLEAALNELGASRASTLEAGRWMVAREQAHKLLGKNVIAASWVMARALHFTTAICAAGTRDNQAGIAQRMGSKPIPGFELIPSEVFNDQLMLLYSDLTAPPPPMLPLLDKMAQILVGDTA